MPGAGPICQWVYGGPGSGKTRQAVTIVCDVLRRGVPADEILFLTFNPGTREILEGAVRDEVGGWSGRLVYTSRMLLDRLLDLIPPWERLIPLSEFQQRLWLRAHLEQDNPWGEDCRLSLEALVKELLPFIRQLKRTGINLGLLRRRIAATASATSLSVLDCIQRYGEDIHSKGYGDFVDQIGQVVPQVERAVAQRRLTGFKLVVVDDLHLAHRMQWQLLEPLLPVASEIHMFSEPEGLFFRQWTDHGYRHRLRELGIKVSYEKLQTSFRLQYPDKHNQPLPDGISVYSGANALEEGLWIAEQVDRLVAESHGKLGFSDVMVITPSQAWASVIHEAFQLYRIPHTEDRIPISQDMLNLIKWLQWFERPSLDSLRMLLLALPGNVSIEGEDVEGLYHCVTGTESSGLGELVSNGSDLAVVCGRIRKLMGMWKEAKTEEVIRSLPGLWIRSRADGISVTDTGLIDAMIGFFTEYRAWCGIVGKRFRIRDFLDAMIAMPDWDLSNASLPRMGDRVQVRDIPGSRGREARIVFVPGLNDGVLPLLYRPAGLIPEEDKETWRRALTELGTPGDLSELDNREDHQRREEERFAIASSRALERMYLTYVTEDGEEALAPSPFLEVPSTSGSSLQVELVQGRFPSVELPLPHEKVLNVPYVPSVKGVGYLLDSLGQDAERGAMLWSAWEEFWRPEIFPQSVSRYRTTEHKPFQLAEDFPLSHSNIQAYLDCPRKFFYEYVLGIEVPKSFHMVVGIVLHLLAQKIHGELGDHVFSDMDGLRAFAKSKLNEQSAQFMGESDMAGWLEYILGRIQNYLRWLQDNPADTRAVETDFDCRWAEGIHFRGRIDRIGRVADSGWGVIDYKKSGNKKAAGLINEFRDRDDDFQFPIYYFSLPEVQRSEIGAFQQFVFDFNNTGEVEAITIPIEGKSGGKCVSVEDLLDVRRRIVEIGREILLPHSDLTKAANTECRRYGGIMCPYVAFCTKSDDVKFAED
jgi:hypothetical protein